MRRPMRRLAAQLALLPVLALALFLSNCANSGKGVSSGTGAAAALSGSDAVASDYQIGPNDILEVTVFQVADLSGVRQVDGAGYIAMPLIGQVRVAGKTPEQAGKEIAAKLGKSYLQSPQVTVLVTKSGQRVTVSGAVGKPIVLTVSGKLTLSQAVAEAGGLSEVANSDRVHVARVQGQRVKDVVFDLDAIQAGQAPDPSLSGGDIVVVESSNAKVAFKTVKDILPFSIFFTPLY